MQKPFRSALVSLIVGVAVAVPLTAQAARVPMAFQGGWDAKVKYRKGDVVVYNNALYQSVRSQSLGRRNIGSVPGASEPDWRLVLGVMATTPTPGNPTPTPGAPGPVGQDCAKPAAGANLAGCDLTGAAAILKDLKLPGINLTGATLTGDAGNVDLTGASLRGANLGFLDQQFKPFALSLGSKAVLKFADLAGATTTQQGGGLKADGVTLDGANLSSATLTHASLKGASLLSTNLDSIHLNNAILSDALLNGANLRNAVLTAADLTNAKIRNANLEYAQFDQGAKLRSADISGANLRGAVFGQTDLTGALFFNADLRGVTGGEDAILGTDALGQNTEFEGATCPDGVKVDGIAATTCVGHGIGSP